MAGLNLLEESGGVLYRRGGAVHQLGFTLVLALFFGGFLDLGFGFRLGFAAFEAPLLGAELEQSFTSHSEPL